MATINNILEIIEQADLAKGEEWKIISAASAANLTGEDWQTVRLYKDGCNEIINTLSNEEKHMFLSWVLMSEGRKEMLRTITGHSMAEVVVHYKENDHNDPIDYVDQEGWEKLAYQRDAYGPANEMLYSLTTMEQLMLMEFIILSEQEKRNV